MNQLNSTLSVPNQKPRKLLPKIEKNEAILPSTKSATQESIERLEYETTGLPLNIDGNGEEVNSEGLSKNAEDLNFKTELELDGYDDIEEYDNDAYSQNVNGRPLTGKQLSFADRPELDSGEESAVDPQENFKTSNI